MPKVDRRKRYKRSGAHSVLSPEMHVEIVRLLEEGNYRETVTSYVGIAYSTFVKWMKDAEAQQEDSPWWELYCDVVKAEAEAEVSAVRSLKTAGSQEPKHAIDYLERRYPRKWGKLVRQEIGGEGGGPLRVDVRGVFEDRLARLASKRSKG